MKQLALIGPTASGKSDLALHLAQAHNALILSLDSLSIYKEIDIASAKPSLQERSRVPHYGIDLIRPDEPFSVSTFIREYRRIKALCETDNKNLIIVGGSSFYLRTLLQGLSPIPEFSQETLNEVDLKMQNPSLAYELLFKADEAYMKNIKPGDTYRIRKMLLIYLQSGMTPTQYFQKNPPQPVIEHLEIYDIDVNRTALKERITLRTQKMLESGLIDEVCALEAKYTRAPNALKAIGIIEVFEYLDGRIDKAQMQALIITHTAQLAKRQQTFNKNQFPARHLLDVRQIRHKAAAYLSL